MVLQKTIESDTPKTPPYLPTINHRSTMEPLAGIEPATYSLRVNCSTPELQRLLMGNESPQTLKNQGFPATPLL